MSFIPSLNKIPSGFQVLSTQPELRIRYSSVILDKTCTLVQFMGCFIFFVTFCLTLFSALHEVLNFRFLQAVQVLSFGNNNPWGMLLFVFLFSLSGVASYIGLWFLLGVIEFRILGESLTIIHRLLGISHEYSISVNDIKCFNHFQNVTSGADGEYDSWTLEVVTNQRRSNRIQSFQAWFLVNTATQMNCKTVHLYDNRIPDTTEWLGKLLADFYRVEFQSASQSNKRNAPER